LAAENESDAGLELQPLQPLQLSETINSHEINGQVGQHEVIGGQKQFREGDEFGLSDTDNFLY
jgi:hypothetical protein